MCKKAEPVVLFLAHKRNYHGISISDNVLKAAEKGSIFASTTTDATHAKVARVCLLGRE